ncbi:hypothetical protein ZYGM_001541 [Zygosaccharomyces mellis]|uniref:Uncharacterized protein n=1 Tax=Zygosaccharomyces mellis TaxID=42258 RepID=A0A4C2EE76_9SACH|nr:hypothetical protein ZYGM_001541 [Zygosaccharomyces mellis]
MRTSLLGEVDAAIFNSLARPLKGVLDGVGDILVNVLDLLGEVVGTVFYLTEDGKLYIEGMDPAAGVPGFSLNDQDELLYKGEQLLGGFDGQNLKLTKNSENNKRNLL